MLVPYISENWQPLFKPQKYGNYVNDHCIYRDNNGLWNLFGITSKDASPSNEKYFVRAVSEDLFSLAEHSKAIDTGCLAWSPCIVENNGFYYMYYGPSPTKMAVSPDGGEWFGYEIRMHGLPPMACHRDHFVMKAGESRWLMYASGIHNKRGSVCVLESGNLEDWYFLGYALDSGKNAELTPAWGAFESPFIVQKNAVYYLFVTYTDCSTGNYNDTLVFVSDNPLNFGIYDGESGAKPITKLIAHAPEIISVGSQDYITTCGWPGSSLAEGVGIARLDWIEKSEPR